MNTITITPKDEIVMRLVHFFITEANYTPIIVNGVKDEVWLENSEAKYKIVRINSNYIHNEEQFRTDLFKIKNVMHQIKRKTVSFTMNTFNIFLDVNENVKLEDEKHIKSIVIHNMEDVEKNKMEKYFPGIENKLLKNTEGLDLIINVTEDINAKTAENNKIYEGTFKPKKIIVTYFLMALCVFIFFLSFIIGKGNLDAYTLYKLGAVSRTAIRNKEIWRLLTGTFLHTGLLHLLVNVYSLCVIGVQLENFVGKKKFLGIYLISAISGSLMSSLFNSGISVGASGAILSLVFRKCFESSNYSYYFIKLIYWFYNSWY